MESLAELFSSRVRASVLGYLVPRLTGRYSLTEFSRALGLPVSSLQHECYKLERLGVLVGRREGNSRRYSWNTDNPANRLLVDLVSQWLGLGHCLAEALTDGNAGVLEAAYVVGDLRSAPRLHLVLVGRIDLEHLETIQHRFAMILDRAPDEIDIAFFGHDAWDLHCRRRGEFVHWLETRPVLILVSPGESG